MQPNLNTIEIKAFVPAKDYQISKRFYQALGFALASDEDGFAYFHHGNTSFLLQDFYVPDLANNLEMHLLVEDVDAWWNHLHTQRIAETFKVKMSVVEQQPWRMRDFTLYDPSGVLWRIAQNTD
jgi:catechol 2,3-dioxygenase-like lactoylglutathione lyase family enzyme